MNNQNTARVPGITFDPQVSIETHTGNCSLRDDSRI